jgi:hypothetical protein
MTILAILLVYGGWQALNGQYSNYFYGAFGIEPELSASANSLGALLGIVTVGFFAKWLAKSGALPQFNFHALGGAEHGAAGDQRSPRPPDVQRGDVAVADE